MESGKIEIGELIRKKMEKEGRKVTWLANKINCQASNISKIYKKSSINSGLLLDISVALEENFHRYYTDIYDDQILEKQNTSEIDVNTPHNRRNN